MNTRPGLGPWPVSEEMGKRTQVTQVQDTRGRKGMRTWNDPPGCLAIKVR